MNPIFGLTIVLLLLVVKCEHSKNELLLNECYKCAQGNQGKNKICRVDSISYPETDKIKCC